MRKPSLTDLSSTTGRTINFLLFQIGWFACVLSAAHQMPWVGSATVAAVVIWHLLHAVRPAEEIKLLSAALLIGAVWESLLATSGWIIYPSGLLANWLAPHWILALWVLFATTLNGSLGWLKQRRLVGALFGAIGGPLSFWSGAKLGGVILVEPHSAIIALALGWAIVTPILTTLATRFDGVDPAIPLQQRGR